MLKDEYHVDEICLLLSSDHFLQKFCKILKETIFPRSQKLAKKWFRYFHSADKTMQNRVKGNFTGYVPIGVLLITSTGQGQKPSRSVIKIRGSVTTFSSRES